MFDRWLGLIMSTIFQPMFIMGFLAFAIQIEDAFIDGNSTSNSALSSCVLPSFDSQSLGTMTNTGSGSCSLAQEIPLNQTNMTAIFEPNATRATVAIPSDPQLQSDNGQAVNVTANAPNIKSNVVGGANQMLAAAPNIALPNHTRIKPTVPVLPIAETMLIFALVSYIMWELMDTIPEMARSITFSVGVGFRNSMDPVNQAVVGGLSGAQHGAITGFNSGTGPLGAAIGAGKGLGQGFLRSTIGRF
jgi:type IV secretory pathway VirB6-like protein